jgi:hypothetical protein
MTDEKNEAEPSGASGGYARGRICPVPPDDPVGPFVAGMLLVPLVACALLSTVTAFCNLMTYGQFCTPTPGVAEKP